MVLLRSIILIIYIVFSFIRLFIYSNYLFIYFTYSCFPSIFTRFHARTPGCASSSSLTLECSRRCKSESRGILSVYLTVDSPTATAVLRTRRPVGLTWAQGRVTTRTCVRRSCAASTRISPRFNWGTRWCCTARRSIACWSCSVTCVSRESCLSHRGIVPVKAQCGSIGLLIAGIAVVVIVIVGSFLVRRFFLLFFSYFLVFLLLCNRDRLCNLPGTVHAIVIAVSSAEVVRLLLCRFCNPVVFPFEVLL